MMSIAPVLALEARGLVKRYKDLTAVAGVDLKLGRGECLALLGPNGAGKTTTVEMLEGLQQPDSGSISVMGRPLATERGAILEQIGVLLQETNLYKRYTVRETLALFASFYRHSLDPDVIMTRLGLTDKAKAQLRTLSGGQKQRVYLGAALINDPALLFLDEPTTGLDPQARRAIWDLVKVIKSEGKSILLTTHYMEEAEVLADRVAIIDQGKIIVEGTPQQLIKSLGGAQVLRVELADDVARARLTAKLPWFSAAKADADGYAVSVPDGSVAAADLFAAASATSVQIKNFGLRPSTLEDVFLKMTGRSIRDA